MNELSKGDKFLIGFAVIVMVAIYFIYPYTWLGKQSYEEQKQNAIIYITACRYINDEGYQKEAQRLIKKYHLEDLFINNEDPLRAFINEHH